MLIAIASFAVPAGTAAAAGDQLPPQLKSDGGQYVRVRPLRTARLTPFRTAYGDMIDLGHFRGRVVLLNFWATWCVPCVNEMPSLDGLAGEIRDPGLAIVPVAIDKTGLSVAARFYREHGLRNLDLYADPDGRTAYGNPANPKGAAFPLYGLPITYVVDHEGRVAGYVTGAVDWQSAEARALIAHYLEDVPADGNAQRQSHAGEPPVAAGPAKRP